MLLLIYDGQPTNTFYRSNVKNYFVSGQTINWTVTDTVRAKS